jgi:hypothetical protein
MHRDLDTKDRVAMLFADLPFWILFGICVAVGMWKVFAGVIAFAITVFLFYRWHRERFSYRCFTCDATFRLPELLPEEANRA